MHKLDLARYAPHMCGRLIWLTRSLTGLDASALRD